MKRLVIDTQLLENYGTVEVPYMKFKGGSTYVLPLLGDKYDVYNKNDIATLVARVKPYITCDYKSSGGGLDEYIIDVRVVNYGEKISEAWDTPTEFSFGKGGNVNFIRVTTNDSEYGYMRKEIVEKTETWTNDRQDYKCEYLMSDGMIIPESEVSEWLDTYAPEPEVVLPDSDDDSLANIVYSNKD